MKNQLLQEMRLMDGLYDPWGSALSMHFAICDELYFRDPDLVPIEWDYSPGAYCNGDPRDQDRYETDLCQSETSENLIKAGNILERYEKLLRKYGKNY